MGYFAPKMASQHLDWVEPGTVGGQIEQDQLACRRSDRRLNLFIFVGGGVIPDNINGASRMFIHEQLKQFNDLALPFLTAGGNSHFLLG